MTDAIPPRQRTLFLLAGILILALAIVPVSAITVTDDAGTSVTVDAPPQRIVSLAPSNTEILAALGLADRIVGITDVCNYPPEVQNITRIGGYSSISTEKVSAVRPDLVVASDITPKETVERLRELGLNVVVIAPRNIDGMIRDIRLAGTLTGTESGADRLAANLSSRLTQITSSPAADRPTIAHVVWNNPLYVSGSDTLQDNVIEHAGGRNAFAAFDGWGTVSLEEFVMKDPDIIIVNGGGGMDNATRDVILEDFLESPRYASLSAVKNHRVYAVNADSISRGGPRIVAATEQVAEIVRETAQEKSAGLAAVSATEQAPVSAIVAVGAVLLAGLCLGLRRERK